MCPDEEIEDENESEEEAGEQESGDQGVFSPVETAKGFVDSAGEIT